MRLVLVTVISPAGSTCRRSPPRPDLPACAATSRADGGRAPAPGNAGRAFASGAGGSGFLAGCLENSAIGSVGQRPGICRPQARGGRGRAGGQLKPGGRLCSRQATFAGLARRTGHRRARSWVSAGAARRLRARTIEHYDAATLALRNDAGA
jgi:hypothetical protein